MHDTPSRPPSSEPFQPLDPGRINLMDPTEAAWWCEQLQVDEGRLRALVDRVGEHVAAVRQALEARPPR